MTGPKKRNHAVALVCFLAAAALPWPVLAVAQVSGEQAVVAGRDINARDIIVRYGLSEQEVLALVRETRETEGPLAEKLAEFAQKLGVTESAVQNFLRILGEKQVPPERLLETLGEIAQRHLDAVQRLAALQPQDPATQELVQEARAAIEVGDYDRADRLLQQAETVELAAVGMAEELARQAQQAADRRRLNAAAILGERGELSLTRLRYWEAAAHFAAASQRVSRSQETQRFSYLTQEVEAYYRGGEEFGDNESLIKAIERCRALLGLLPRERLPLEWARTQSNLGVVLLALGERESGTQRLEEAVEAHRAALQEWTRERAALDWAITQTNLGNALQRLGERESGTQRLEEAVEAYRAALEEGTREQAALQWATTQNNLGAALQGLGEREGSTQRLEEAVEAYRAALQERTRERVPLNWAATQNNLGTALQELGDRESGTKRLEEAVTAYRDALKELTRERVPLQWAMTQNNLGNALQALGAREYGTQRLEEAVEAHRAALQERTRERAPLQWARSQNNLGAALQELGERESGTKRLEEAVAAFRAALQERTRERVPLDWAMTQKNLGTALQALGSRTYDWTKLEEARSATAAAFDAYMQAGQEYRRSYYEDLLQAISREIAALNPDLPAIKPSTLADTTDLSMRVYFLQDEDIVTKEGKEVIQRAFRDFRYQGFDKFLVIGNASSSTPADKARTLAQRRAATVAKELFMLRVPSGSVEVTVREQDALVQPTGGFDPLEAYVEILPRQ